MKLSTFYAHLKEAAEQTGLPLSVVFSRVRSAGVTGVELDLADYDREGPALADRLTEAGLQVSSVYASHAWGTESSYETGLRQAEISQALGAASVMVIPGFLSEEEADEMHRLSADAPALHGWMESNPRILRMLEGLRRTVAFSKLPVTLEDFDGLTSPCSIQNGLKFFMDRIPELQFTMDTGNFAFCDEDAITAFHTLRDRIVHLHAKDRGEEPEILSCGYRFNRGLAPVAVGHGYIPVREIITSMISSGYDGWIALEHFGSPRQLEDIVSSAQFLRSL